MTVEITTLPGGLRVATERNDCVESVSLGIWVDVGTRYESKRFHGISHLLEHMVFKGTAKRSASRIAEEIEAVGGYINAYTSREHTTHYARVLKQDVKLALDILSDILLNSTFKEAELKREKEVTKLTQPLSFRSDTTRIPVFSIACSFHMYSNICLQRTQSICLNNTSIC